MISCSKSQIAFDNAANAHSHLCDEYFLMKCIFYLVYTYDDIKLTLNVRLFTLLSTSNGIMGLCVVGAKGVEVGVGVYKQ